LRKLALFGTFKGSAKNNTTVRKAAHLVNVLGNYPKNCAESEILCREYEDAAMTYFTLEKRLLLALQQHEYDSVRDLKLKTERAWRIRISLRAGIRQREMRKSATRQFRTPLEGSE
jgi:hypothetical protein